MWRDWPHRAPGRSANGLAQAPEPMRPAAPPRLGKGVSAETRGAWARPASPAGLRWHACWPWQQALAAVCGRRTPPTLGPAWCPCWPCRLEVQESAARVRLMACPVAPSGPRPPERPVRHGLAQALPASCPCAPQIGPSPPCSAALALVHCRGGRSCQSSRRPLPTSWARAEPAAAPKQQQAAASRHARLDGPDWPTPVDSAGWARSAPRSGCR
jgi:hypothetical protein